MMDKNAIKKLACKTYDAEISYFGYPAAVVRKAHEQAVIGAVQAVLEACAREIDNVALTIASDLKDANNSTVADAWARYGARKAARRVRSLIPDSVPDESEVEKP